MRTAWAPSRRKRPRTPAVPILAVAASLVFASPAAAVTRGFSSRSLGHGAYVFRMTDRPSETISAAALVRGRARQPLRRSIVQRAYRSGIVRVRPNGRLAVCLRIRCHITLVVRFDRTSGLPKPSPPKPSPLAPGETSSACAFGSFTAGNWPGSCWRPYSDSSPLNRTLPQNPPLAADSALVIARMASWGRPSDYLTARGDGATKDYEHPYYFSHSGDPAYTIHCAERWGTCAVEGMRIHVPDGAQPANGPDAHMAVIDQAGGWEYDLWKVLQKSPGQLTVSWGGRTPIGGPDATGLSGGGTASGLGLLAGVIRAPELLSGNIPHALFMVVRCDGGRFVYPADGVGHPCSDVGEPNAGAPAMGQHLRLAMSDPQIDALGTPVWQRAILRAMAHYGLIVGDTGGDPWDLEFESDATYASFGASPAVRDAFRLLGARHSHGAGYDTYHLDMVPIDWARYLQVVDPCVDRGTC